jgi:hypothetical protein
MGTFRAHNLVSTGIFRAQSGHRRYETNIGLILILCNSNHLSISQRYQLVGKVLHPARNALAFDRYDCKAVLDLDVLRALKRGD